MSEARGAGPAATTIEELAGEEAFGLERLILTPAPGRFVELDHDVRPRAGDVVLAGQPIGVVERARDEIVVWSPFSGVVAGMIALPGERLIAHQPVAWLRVGGGRW